MSFIQKNSDENEIFQDKEKESLKKSYIISLLPNIIIISTRKTETTRKGRTKPTTQQLKDELRKIEYLEIRILQ